MNIGIVTYWFERGAAYVSQAYLKTLSREHNVFIYSRGGEEIAEGNPRWDSSIVTWGKRLKNIDQGKYIVWKDFKKWLKNNKIEIIIFNEQQSWDVILRLRKSKYLIGAYVDYYTFETVPFFKLYDFLLCNTKRHYEVFREHLQTYFLQWGTDVTVCRPQQRRNKGDEVVFFHSAGMGGINLRKGTDLLVKAFEDVKGPARLIIHSQVGLEKYSDAADLIRHDTRIKFIQGTYPLPGLYNLGDVYVYPSKLEGIGLSISEALSCGLPVITTNNAPMNEFVENGSTGTLVDVASQRMREDRYYWPETICSLEELTNAMQDYVDHPSLIEVQSKNARIEALSKFNWEKNSENLASILCNVRETRSWSKREIDAIDRYETARNIFFVDARHRLSGGDKRAALISLTRLIVYHPIFVFKKETWVFIKDLLFDKNEIRNLNQKFMHATTKGITLLPLKIRNRIFFLNTKKAILKTYLFDQQWYLANNKDVQSSSMDPLFHYLFFGAYEGRNPSLFFDGNRYLADNPDVKISGMNPLVHYLYYGMNEGRRKIPVLEKLENTVIDDRRILKHRELDDRELKVINGKTVDIVIWVADELADVQKCVESVIPTITTNDKIIFIDHQSNNSTCEYLAYIQRILPGKIDLHHTHNKYSLPEAMNFGISGSNADFTVFLKSDSIVSEKWLSKLVGKTFLDQSIGIVSPLSTEINVQLISSIKFADANCLKSILSSGLSVADINRFCEKKKKTHGYAVVPFVKSSCMLIKREAFQRIGLFENATFRTIYDEEIDYCFRASDAGYVSLIATDTFVHHNRSTKLENEIRTREITNSIRYLENKYPLNRLTIARDEIADHPVLKEIYVQILKTFLN